MIKAIIRIKNLTKNKAKCLIISIDDRQIRTNLHLGFSEEMYNELLSNLKQNILVEIDKGNLVKILGETPTTSSDNLIVLDFIHILRTILKDKSMKKKELAHSLSKYLNRSESTCKRKIKEAVDNEILSEVNYHNVKLKS